MKNKYEQEKETFFIPQKINLFLRGKRDFSDIELMYMSIYAFNHQNENVKYKQFLDIRESE